VSDSPDDAAHRLALSRERLRLAMRQDGGADGSVDRSASTQSADSADPTREGSWPNWLNRMRESPALEVLFEVIRQRWQRHPLRLAAQVAGDLADGWIKPVAREHPIRLVVGALVVGAVVAWARPWRLLPSPARWSVLAMPIVSKAVALVPLESLLLALTSFAQQSIRRDPPPPR